MNSTIVSDDTRSSDVLGQWRAALVVIQVGISVGLLSAGFLFYQTLYGLHRVNLGIRESDVLSFNVAVPIELDDDWTEIVYREIESQLAQLKDVAGVARGPVFETAMSDEITIYGRQGNVHAVRTPVLSITANYFSAVGATMQSGRMFANSDGPRSRRVAIVNEEFSARYFSSQSPLDGRIAITRAGSMLEYAVVGVVKGIRHGGPRSAISPAIYVSSDQQPPGGNRGFVVRSLLPPGVLVDNVRRIVQNNDSKVIAPQFLTDQLDRMLVKETALSTASLLLAGLVVTLSIIGIYSLMSSFVSRRTRELAVRLALGATSVDVFTIVLSAAARLLLVGAIGGMGVIYLGSQALSGLFHGLPTIDWLLVGLACCIVSFFGVVAAAFPAWRATRVDPMKEIRQI